MTNDSKFCDETVTRRHSAEAEFWALVAGLGIDLNAMVDPRTELSFAMARRRCGTCSSKEKCREARQRVVTLSDVAAFCPSVDVFVDLLRCQPYDRGGRRPLAHPLWRQYVRCTFDGIRVDAPPPVGGALDYQNLWFNRRASTAPRHGRRPLYCGISIRSDVRFGSEAACRHVDHLCFAAQSGDARPTATFRYSNRRHRRTRHAHTYWPIIPASPCSRI